MKITTINGKNTKALRPTDTPEKFETLQVAVREGKTQENETKTTKKAPNTPHSLPPPRKGKVKKKKKKKRDRGDRENTEGVCTQQAGNIEKGCCIERPDDNSLIPDGAGVRL